MLFDTHAHYDDDWFSDDAYSLLDMMQENNVGLIVNACTKISGMEKILSFCEKYPFMYASVGIYPHDAVDVTERDMDMMREYAKHEKVVAIGEIGLDYHYDTVDRKTQKYWFERQVDIANEVGLPVIIHDRDAHRDVLDILREHNAAKCGGVFHCYSGSAEMVREVLELNMYLAFGGSVTFKNAKKTVEAAKCVPDDRLLTETDSPYLAPVPLRGERNSSLNIHYVAEKLAEIRGDSVSHIEKITYENGKKLFKIMQ